MQNPCHVLGVLAVLALPAAASPQIIQASDPVRPDEAVLVIGDAFGKGCSVEMAQLPDGPATAPREKSPPAAKKWQVIQPLQGDERSLKVVVPKDWPQGVWACRVRQGGLVSEPVILNAPEAWWWNGDAGESATPGGGLRVFGKSLNFGGESLALLRAADGRSLTLKADKPDAYALAFTLPADLAAGDYELFVHNGLGGYAAWRAAGTVVIRAPVAWKSEVFNVKDFGPKPGDALLAALARAKSNGGGVVYLPRGRYEVKSTLAIPPNTVLRGEAMEWVSLYWPDFEPPPADLVTGADFGIESLSLYCQNHKNVIAVDASSTRCFFRHLRIRADSYFMIEEAGKEFRGRSGPAKPKECGAAVLLRGRNFEVSDCEIYASGIGVRILKAKTGQVARNRIRYGAGGYAIENTERLIFEDNQVTGADLTSRGNGFSTYFSTCCWHTYFARNSIQQVYGADREMMTLDAAAGAYFGTLATVAGTRLTLAKDPEYHDYSPRPRTDWTGAVVQVLTGKGAGQYRFVTSNKCREWQVDRPWTVVPDHESCVSIAPFRGQNLFIANRFEDGGAFQLYAAAHDSIVANNRGARMDGFYVCGLNPHGWGLQPSWFCQFFDNEITEGNGYGPRASTFGTVADDESKAFKGPLVSGAVFRRNIGANNASFNLGGATADVIVEHCVVRHTDVGIKVAASVKGVLLRDNTFEDVGQNEAIAK